MGIFQRVTKVKAIQFFEKDFKKNSLLYPEVWDKAMFSELWANKTAKDGRYYITKQSNTIGEAEYIAVNDGDYIIREEMGIVYTMPKEIFEKHFEKVQD